ncbi:MAG: tetratricopeptide repeat protein [Acidobacteriota bacterium]
MNARRFAEAVGLYERIQKLEPEDVTLLNSLGYAQFFNGDLESARKSFTEYAKTPGQEANGLDSLGEVLLMAGQFTEAEGKFKEAHTRNPELLNGGDLMKAAYAHWLGGDLPGADKMMEEYFTYRAQHNDQTVIWRRALWSILPVGRMPPSLRLKAAMGPVGQLAQRQLLVWQNAEGLIQDIPALERGYRGSPPAADGIVRTLYARALARAGRTQEAAKLIALWPLPEIGDPLLQGFQYPYFLELKKSLPK